MGRLLSLKNLRPELCGKEAPKEQWFKDAVWRSQTSRASNPRDKIFALESLLPKWVGRLIYIDYKEPCEYVFKRVTARLYNDGGTFMASICPLLTERHYNTRGPSWVLDFTYSDALLRQSKIAYHEDDPVALSGFIYENGNSHPVCNEMLKDNHNFATPTTIFCTGIRVDYIWKTAQIQRPSSERKCPFIAALAYDVDIKRRSRRGLKKQESLPGYDFISPGLLSLIFFFALQAGARVPGGNMGRLLQHRLDAILGKHYFITEGGIVGLAASPVKEGDCLALRYNTPVYLIMRQVQDHERSTDTVQHRVVARAVVHDDELTGMTSLIKNLPRERFEIV